MSETGERSLSWLVTLLSGAYVAWTAYTVTTRVPTFSALFAGIGAELPAFTRVVIELSSPVAVWPVTVLLLALLLAKQFWPISFRTNLLVDVAVFFGAALVAAVVAEAMFRPMFALIQQVG